MTEFTPRQPSLDRKQILLVEDNEAHAKLILRAMQDGQIANHVKWVRDGEAALDFVLRRGEFRDPSDSPRPDLIILDLKLPKIDGIDVLRSLKNNPTSTTIPVVVLSSSTNQRDIDRAYQNHANSYICKPFDFSRLREVVQALAHYWTEINADLREPHQEVPDCRTTSSR